MCNVCEVCGQRFAISILATRSCCNCSRILKSSTIARLVERYCPVARNLAVVQSCFCRCSPAFCSSSDRTDHGRTVVSTCVGSIGIIKDSGGIAVSSVLATRSNVTNLLPCTSSTRFCSVCILQLHVGCGNALVQYHEWNPAFVEAFLEFYRGENGIVIALNNESCFGVSAC